MNSTRGSSSHIPRLRLRLLRNIAPKPSTLPNNQSAPGIGVSPGTSNGVTPTLQQSTSPVLPVVPLIMSSAMNDARSPGGIVDNSAKSSSVRPAPVMRNDNGPISPLPPPFTVLSMPYSNTPKPSL